MNRFFISSLFAFLLVSVSSAHATTAGELRANCAFAAPLLNVNDANNAIKAGFCLGYVTGVVQAYNNLYVAQADGKIRQAHINDDTTCAQAVRIFKKYIDDHPELKNEQAKDVIAASLVEANLLFFTELKTAPPAQVH